MQRQRNTASKLDTRRARGDDGAVYAATALPCPRAERGDATSVLDSDVCEATWFREMTPHRERWRARAADRGVTLAQREYAERRAGSLERAFAARVDECKTAGFETKCGCPGKRGYRWHPCRQHLVCAWCRWQRSLKLTVKMRNALEHQASEHPRRDRARRYLMVMMTMALRHSGNVRRDRFELAEAWKRFRLACTRRWGAFPFVGTFEVTPGDDGLGHVHLHVVTIWPRGAPGDETQGDWALLRKLWLAASTLDGVERSTRVSFVASNSGRKAAGYVSKYVAKGVLSAGFGPQLAAKVIAGTYNTRWVVTSRGFWLPFEPVCPCCGEPVVRATFDFTRDVGPPPPNIDWEARGSPRRYTQAIFAFPDPHERGSHSGTVGRTAVHNGSGRNRRRS